MMATVASRRYMSEGVGGLSVEGEGDPPMGHFPCYDGDRIWCWVANELKEIYVKRDATSLYYLSRTGMIVPSSLYISHHCNRGYEERTLCEEDQWEDTKRGRRYHQRKRGHTVERR
ncbi:hypothetical protein R6Q59_024103 [Mikania micrantha]